jgi:hypothetical protein
MTSTNALRFDFPPMSERHTVIAAQVRIGRFQPAHDTPDHLLEYEQAVVTYMSGDDGGLVTLWGRSGHPADEPSWRAIDDECAATIADAIDAAGRLMSGFFDGDYDPIPDPD